MFATMWAFEEEVFPRRLQKLFVYTVSRKTGCRKTPNYDVVVLLTA